MPKDQRLYITLPIDIHRHPKLRNQSAEVKWAFVEMNIEAVIAGNDGRFTAEDAEFLWPAAVLDALTKTHPTRPLVIRDGDAYVIREFAEHQMTTADRERRAEVSRANGRKGGRPKKPAGTQAEPGQVSEMTKLMASQDGITSLQSVIDSTQKHAHRTIKPEGALQLGKHLLAKAKTYPRNPQMYVTRSISLSPFEVQQFIDENALAVAS